MINPGVDLERFFPREGGLTRDPVVFFAGELRPDKGIRDVIAAAEQVRKSIPGLRLIVAGDGPLRSEVVDHARDKGFIDYRGQVPRDELPAIYREARSLRSGSPISLALGGAVRIRLGRGHGEWPAGGDH